MARHCRLLAIGNGQLNIEALAAGELCNQLFNPSKKSIVDPIFNKAIRRQQAQPTFSSL